MFAVISNLRFCFLALYSILYPFHLVFISAVTWERPFLILALTDEYNENGINLGSEDSCKNIVFKLVNSQTPDK